MVTPEANPIFFIVGATSCGKSSAAMMAAVHTPGIEIVAADRYTTWAEMDIGTAKPNAKDQRQVPHHLVDIFHLGSLAGRDMGPRYQQPEHDNMEALGRLANQAFTAINGRDGYALAVGGSPIAIESLRNITKQLPNPEWRRRVAAMGDKELFEFCESWDYAFDYEGSADSVREKLIWQTETYRSKPKPNALTIGIHLLGRDMTRRMLGRINQMWDEGLPHEVAQLVEEYGWVGPLKRAIGYKEFMAEDGKGIGSHNKAREEIIANTMAFAWNQSIAFRKYANILWLNHPEQVAQVIGTYIQRFKDTGVQPAEFTRDMMASGAYGPR